jgi:glycolate dehydrogenase FAD-binding subunit
MTDEQSLARSIASIVGADHSSANPELKIDGLSPALLVRPASAEEAAACMKVCSESNAAVVPAGQMSWLECGNPLERADVVLSLERMRRIIDYSPPDLTATVEAGLTLSEFNAATGRERQWLPLDPPGFKQASLGAIAACNSSGALRLGFGTPRDYVIGLKLVHADGTESKSGGKVVKNVAGYDMNKLYTGSYGTLAIITELTFKLRPVPDFNSTILITSQSRDLLFQLAKQVRASELQPASVVLTRRLSGSFASTWPHDALLIRFIDSEAAVKHQVNWVKEAIDQNYNATVLNENQAAAVWAEVADFDQRANRVRLSVPLSETPAEFEKALLAHVDCVAVADIGAGMIRLAFNSPEGSAVDQINRLRASVAVVNGTLVIEKAPVKVRRSADAWGDVGSAAALTRSIKTRFDPQSLLNPGKFVLGL